MSGCAFSLFYAICKIRLLMSSRR